MALNKAFIQPLDEKDDNKGSPIEVMFNPAEYSIDKSNQFQSTPILGLSTPLTQFVSGNAETLTMDLFFDTYEKRESVAAYTDKLMSLIAIEEHLHAPPRCRFIWGRFNFKATVEKIIRKFTMFLEDGTPVRATLSITFKEYKTFSDQIGNPPRSSADRTKRRIFTEGDSLWLMAYREYGDPRKWRRIAEANNIDNPRIVETGRELKLPPFD